MQELLARGLAQQDISAGLHATFGHSESDLAQPAFEFAMQDLPVLPLAKWQAARGRAAEPALCRPLIFCPGLWGSDVAMSHTAWPLLGPCVCSWHLSVVKVMVDWPLLLLLLLSVCWHRVQHASELGTAPPDPALDQACA